ncbi:MAG: GTPase Era [Bacteroidetes bacterium]|nr:GTPase Era [Bacteroidota bacterium]
MEQDALSPEKHAEQTAEEAVEQAPNDAAAPADQPNQEGPKHYAGFINIIGRPNVGKSTLTNALVGEKLSVITPKAQTTRHRIFGLVNGDDYQMVFSDTPGIIHEPMYKLQKQMNEYVHSSFLDADVMLLVTEPGESFADDDPTLERLGRMEIPLMVLINKADKGDPEQLKALHDQWQGQFPRAEVRIIAAKTGEGVAALKEKLRSMLPEHPPYFDKDTWTDRPERFFVTEIVREKILLNYKQEIPYSVEVAVETFQETEAIIRIRTLIFANRQSQKAILIGREGQALKRVGMAARQDLETFFGKQVHLELFVKVREGWRDKEADLRSFGYDG